ncbi:hypothetical protein [Pantoea agglomerans]|jgi:chromosome segregation ATPase|uniref:hypothetical protein n=1 Tax=Enterobacter agglomerans TaxID=549 RepID=UPI0017844F44|nr:hypothetical protein [Pantoea agglomerans]MBD8241346.1 hypothetical protein [Pantoea agglomerans]
MAFDITKEFFIGAGGSLAASIAGVMAFGRYWVSSRAQNANDKSQINMLQWQMDQLKLSKEENKQLRDEIEERDETIRKYWAEISETKTTLQIIQLSQKHLEEQNTLLKEQVRELTTSNMEMVKQLIELRESLRVQ